MKLFTQNPCFENIPLEELGKNFIGTGSEVIAVAGFQRNAVWKEFRVEELWDSILSGFPIGSILLAPYQEERNIGYRKAQITKSGNYPDTILSGSGVDYIIVDGQQRMNAIALGFMPFSPDARARLWIDLAEPANRNQTTYEFHLCTQENPFGVYRREPLTKDEKRRALQSINNFWADDAELPLDETYPFKAKLPIPFHEFCQILRLRQPLDRRELDWKKLCDLLFKDDLHLSETTKKLICDKFMNGQHLCRVDLFGQFINALEKTVLQGGMENQYQVPAILIQELDNRRLGKLFERVNINGEVPPQSELFYSALKLRKPLVNNYISEIYNDSELQNLLRPTQLILVALRLVDSTITELQLGQFEKQFEGNQEQLLKLLEKDGNQKSIFHECMSLCYQALLYQGNGDFGLPRQLLLRIRPQVWQTLVYWISKKLGMIKDEGQIDRQSRMEMIRYAMLDYFRYFIYQSRSDPSRYTSGKPFISTPFEIINKIDYSNNIFPGHMIAKNIQIRAGNDGWNFHLLSPSEFFANINPSEDSDRPNYFRLVGEEGLLYFAQRDFLNSFPNIRYDIDHIIPSSWMNFRGPTPSAYFWRVTELKNESYLRHLVMNSLGNFRFWPDSLNRAYKDKPPREKYITSNLNFLIDEELHKHRRLGVVRDVIQHSFIDEDLLTLIEELQNHTIKSDHRIWDNERFHIFKVMVDQRRYLMYKNLFDTIQWDDWNDMEEM